MGTLLPDVDHLIYVYFMRPHEVTSQRVDSLVQKGQINKTLNLLYITREERAHLTFHTAHFQLIFLALTFLVLTSSGSIFGTGIVLAFSLHLLVDQVIDFMELGNINTWLEKMSIHLDRKQQIWYMVAIGATLLIFGFLL